MIGTKTVIDKVDYKEYSNWQLLSVPLGLLALAIGVLAFVFVTTGSPVLLGVEFVGGSELRIAPQENVDNPRQLIETGFDTPPSSVQQIPSDGAFLLTFGTEAGDIQGLENTATDAGFKVLSSSSVSPTFGGDSQRLTLVGLTFAFIGMSIIVFGLFRTAIPSVAVVASAFSDLVVPLAFMNVVGIELSLGTVAALLLLIGYSVDSDMLLNDYVVRRSGDYYEGVYTAMDTGLTMTLTSVVAMSILALGGFISGIPLLQNIGLIIGFGLLVDIINTYMMNVSLLRWYRYNAGDLR